METLTSWLGAIGLDRYAPLFEAHGIELRSLPLLGDRDLIALGVLLGHRRLLLKAIATLDGASHNESTAPPAAERRQLTVLFCDLVDSTALAQRLDAEELRDLMRAYQHVCRRVVAGYDGHVAQYLGDGLVVYFGFPQAHEDDPERAARAALDIVAAVNQLSEVEPLHVRVGIATGPVVVGGDSGDDASIPSVAVGQTPNLAARLQAFAGPDQIVIAPGTHHLLGNIFDVEDLGDRTLKGIERPVHVRRIRGLALRLSRFDAAHTDRSTSFVGRTHEVALLLSRWERAREGEGQIVLLTGEPGIGKSRTARVVRDRLKESAHLRPQYQCSPYHSGSAFHPIIEQIARACGFERDDPPPRKLDKLEAMLALPEEQSQSVAPFFASLLSLPIDRYPRPMLSAQKHRELTITALVNQMLRLASKGPVLVVFEDLQWADPSTLETLAQLVEHVGQAAILLVITYRPDFEPPWADHGNVTVLRLNRLSKRQSAEMADSLSGGKALPDEVLAQIVERTDGVPLFVEELTKVVFEAGFLHDVGDSWELRGALPALTIPSTLRDSLTARLDRVPAVKEVAQIGACIGRVFDHELLAAVASMTDGELLDAMDKLVASGLVSRRGSGRETVYSFKHALVQDVAYDGLLKRRRQQIHQDIARALAGKFPELAKARPELLAIHLTRADLIDQALPQWRTAARSAIADNRHREALGHIDTGLALVDRAPVALRANIAVGLLVAGIGCHWALSGYACKPAAALSARAEALLEGVTDQRLLILALAGIHLYAYVGADTPKALATAERLVALGHATTDMYARVAAFSAVGPILWQQGEFERCRTLLEFIVNAGDSERRSAYGRIGDAKVNACVWLSWVLLWTGQIDQSRRYARGAIDRATLLVQPFALAEALGMAARPLAEAGNCEEALALCSRCIALCDAQTLPFWKGWAIANEGIALVMLAEYERAEVRLRQAIAHLLAGGARNDLGRVYSWRTLALAKLGRFEEARRDSELGRAECVETGQLLALAELDHARGVTEMLDCDADPAAAEHWLQASIDNSRSNGMRLIELRAATSLARLWRREGKCQDARSLLAPIASGFTEGFDGLDLKEASAFLDELEPP